MADFLNGDPSSFPQHDKLDLDAFRAALIRAQDIGQPIPPLPEDPSLPAILGAAFRQSNSVGSLMSSRSLANTLNPKDEQPIAPSTVLQNLKEIGLAHHAGLFEDVTTKGEFDARVADLKQELKDRETLHASGGLLAEFAVGVIDPVNFIPVAGGVAKARAGMKAGQALSRRAVLEGAAADGFVSAGLQEAALQTSQVNRDGWDGAANIGASTIFGVGLGFGAHGLTQFLGRKLANKVETRVDAAMDDLRAGGPKMSARLDDALKAHEDMMPASAAMKGVDIETPVVRDPSVPAPKAKAADVDDIPVYTQSDRPDPRLQPASAGAAAKGDGFPEYDLMNAKFAGVNMATLIQKAGQGFGKVAEVEVGGVKILGALGQAMAQGLRHPRLDLVADKVSLNARKLVLSLVANPNPIAKEGPEGGHRIAVGKHFDEEYAPYNGAAADAKKQVHDIWVTNKTNFKNIDEFGERVYFAAINGGVDKFGQNPAIEQAAKIINSVYVLHEKGLQETGWLKEGVQLRGAESYVPWVHKVQTIIDQKDDFIKTHADAIAHQFEQDYVDALHVRSMRAIAKADEMKVVDAEINVKLDETNKKFVGDKDNIGKIEEARRDRREVEDRLKQEKKDGLDEIQQRYKDNLAGGMKEHQANQKFRSERERFLVQFEKRSDKQIEAARLKIEQVQKEQKAALAELESQRQAKYRELNAKFADPPDEDAMLKLKTEEQRAKRADEIANRYYESIVKGGDELDLLDGPDVIAFPSVLKARKAILTQTETAARDWLDTNIFHVTDAYTRRVGAFIAASKTFKKPVDVQMPDGSFQKQWHSDPNATYLKKQIKEDYDIAISASGGGEKEAALRQAQAEQLINAELLHDARMGRTQGFSSAALQRAAGYAQQFNSWRLMGGSVLSSLGDPMNIAMAHGFAPTMSNGVAPAMSNFKAYMGLVPKELEPDILRINRISGAVMEREANSVLGAMMDLNAPNSGRTTGQAFAENMTRMFWKYSGLEFWTQFWKNALSGVVHARIIDAAQRGWDTLSAAERTWLTNNRIDQDVLGRVKSMHDQQPQKYSAGIQYGAIDQWSDKEAARRFAFALQQESNFGIVTPDAGNKLAFQFTPMGRLFGQFRSFGFTNASTVIARNVAINNIAGEKAGNLYGGLLGLATMGAIVDAVKFAAGDTTFYGSSKKDPSKTSLDLYTEKWRKTPGEALYNALDRSSVFMPLTEVSNIAQKLGLPNIQGGLSLAFRDEKSKKSGSSRFANRTFAEAALGPTVGLVEDFVGASRLGFGAFGSAVGINEAFKPTSAQYSGFRRLIPFQNAPAAQQFLNTVHQHIGTAYDWPKE